LGEFMDGEGTACQAGQDELCDRCDGGEDAVGGEVVEAEGQVTVEETEEEETEVEDGEGEGGEVIVKEDEETEEEEDGKDEETAGEAGMGQGMRGEMTRVNRLKRDVQNKAEGWMRMRRWLDEVGNNCAVCYVKWHQHDCGKKFRRGWLHGPEACSWIRYEEYVEWRRRIRFGDYSCCWGCGLL